MEARWSPTRGGFGMTRSRWSFPSEPELRLLQQGKLSLFPFTRTRFSLSNPFEQILQT